MVLQDLAIDAKDNTPYPIEDGMSTTESDFNYRHSRTRITAERAIGMLKNRFRVLKLPLNQQPNESLGLSAYSQIARLLEVFVVLYNLFLKFMDDEDVSPVRKMNVIRN